jgi:alanine adding enzyme
LNFTTLTEEEFRSHALNNELSNFLQTPAMKRLREQRGWSAEYVGVKDGETVVASAMLARMKIRFGYYYDIDGGFIADYSNKEVVTTFIDGLKKYLKEKGALYVTMTPNITYQERDWNGTAVGKPDNATLELLKSLGFSHHGFEHGFSNSSPRWVFVKDMEGLEATSLRKSYQKDANYSLKKTAQFGIQIRDLDYDELPKFKKLTEHTAERRSFNDKDLSYYQTVYKEFGDSAKFVVAEINFATYIDNLNQRKNELQERLNGIYADLEKNPNSRKKNNQKREFEDELRTFDKRIKEAEEFRKEDGNEDIILAGALFIIGAHEVIYLFSGTYDKYKNFYAPFLIQDKMLELTVERGIPKYNFYGINGNFDGSDGVLKFKQSFTGNVEEKIGSFDLVIQPIKYKIYNSLRNLTDKVRG